MKSTSTILAIILFLALCIGACRCTTPVSTSDPMVHSAQQVVLSTCSVGVKTSLDFEGIEPLVLGEGRGSCTNIKITRDRVYALTARHVVGSPISIVKQEITVSARPNTKYLPGRVEQISKRADLALISYERPAALIRSLRLGSASPYLGQKAIISGNPGNFRNIIFFTRVIGRCGHNMACEEGIGLSYLTARAVEQGQSGGPIVNEQGRLIGIVHGLGLTHHTYEEELDYDPMVGIFVGIEEVQRFLRETKLQL